MSVDNNANFPTLFLTIRLSDAESRSLTRLRGGYEFFETHLAKPKEHRLTIRDLLGKLIIDSAELHKKGLFELPFYNNLPGLSKDEIDEQISLKKNAEESAALKVLSVRQNGVEITYGQADMVRILINLAEIDRTKKLKS